MKRLLFFSFLRHSFVKGLHLYANGDEVTYYEVTEECIHLSADTYQVILPLQWPMALWMLISIKS